MKIYLAADHAGFKLKEVVKKWLAVFGKKYEIEDFGAFEFKKTDDYPDFMRKVGRAISRNPDHKAIIFGGSGQGEAMVCNHYKRVRAAVYYGGDDKVIILSREHNDANVLAIGAFFVKEDEALRAVELWLKTPFSKAARHKRRIGKF